MHFASSSCTERGGLDGVVKKVDDGLFGFELEIFFEDPFEGR